MTFTIERYLYGPQTTIGKLLDPNGKHICYTLEDTVRACGIKLDGHTAIPEGRYTVTVNVSTRFKREMVLLSNTDSVFLIKVDNVEFSGVRMHGGNRHEDSEGCPLVAHNIDPNKLEIWKTAEKEVTKKFKKALEKGNIVYLDIINKTQDA